MRRFIGTGGRSVNYSITCLDRHARNLLGGEAAMFSFDSYREVLSEHAGRGHLVGAAWLLLIILGLVIVLFA